MAFDGRVFPAWTSSAGCIVDEPLCRVLHENPPENLHTDKESVP
jgi:hypothetical protein